MNAETKQAMFNLNDKLENSTSNRSMIEVSREDLMTVVNHLYESDGEWSNHAALGYLIAAAESKIFMKREIKDLANGMRREFDFKTLEEAAELYRKSDY